MTQTAKRISLPVAKLRNIDHLYAELPKIECKQLCQECCGPIIMTRLEWLRIIRQLGFEPKGDLKESLVCPMLDQGQGTCSVYGIRPIICRLWGLVEKMKCPHGCVPERWLTDEEAYKLIIRMAQLGR